MVEDSTRARRNGERERERESTHRTASLMTPAVSIPAVLFAVLSCRATTTVRARRQRQLGVVDAARGATRGERVRHSRACGRAPCDRACGEAPARATWACLEGRCSIAFRAGVECLCCDFSEVLNPPQPSSTLPKMAILGCATAWGSTVLGGGSGRLLRVLRLRPPFLPIGSDLKKTLFCLELEGFSGLEQEGSRGPHFPLHPLHTAWAPDESTRFC